MPLFTSPLSPPRPQQPAAFLHETGSPGAHSEGSALTEETCGTKNKCNKNSGDRDDLRPFNRYLEGNDGLRIAKQQCSDDTAGNRSEASHDDDCKGLDER